MSDMNENNNWSTEMRSLSEILFEIKADIAVIKNQLELREKQHTEMGETIKGLEIKVQHLDMMVAESKAAINVLGYVWKASVAVLTIGATGAYIFVGGA